MLELTLSIAKNVVSVKANGADSHMFPLEALGLTEGQAKAFLDDPAPYGQRLYTALFPSGSPAEQALKALPLAPSEGSRIVLRLEHENLNQAPWEYLHNGRVYLAADYALIRTVPLATPFSAPAMPERMALLFIPSDPLLHGNAIPEYSLGVDTEWDDLLACLTKGDPALDLTKVVPPTIAGLQEAAVGLRGGIVHFTGHGAAGKDKSFLLFEKKSGAGDPVEATSIASLLRGKAALMLLSACQSATPGESEEANLAALLSRQGMPFVLGMQLSVPDASVRHFTNTFYEHLFAGEDLFEAVRQARLAVLNDSDLPQAVCALVMGIPVLYAADPSGEGKFRPAGNGLQTSPLPRPDLEGLPTAESGFYGRQRELVQIGEHLTAERPRQGENYLPLTVTLHGPGGIGKTALLRKAAFRFAWAFEGVLAVPLEPLPSLESVLERLEKFLGLTEGGRLDTESRAARAAEALHGKHILLALDNFESLAYAREGQDDVKKHTAADLFKFLRSLPTRGITLLTSSREPTGLPGEVRVEVPGLDEQAGADCSAPGFPAARMN